jgi:hypothetical protein
MDEHMFPRPEATLDEERLPGSEAREGERGGGVVTDAARLGHEPVLRHQDELGQRAVSKEVGNAKDGVAYREPLHLRPDLDHLSRQLVTGYDWETLLPR